MSYSVCIHGSSMCDGCMECYDRRNRYSEEDDIFCIVDPEDDHTEVEEEDDV